MVTFKIIVVEEITSEETIETLNLMAKEINLVLIFLIMIVFKERCQVETTTMHLN